MIRLFISLPWRWKELARKMVTTNDWQFWQQYNKPLEITGQQMLDEKLLYIHQNPVRQVL